MVGRFFQEEEKIMRIKGDIMTKARIINEIKNQHVHLFWGIMSTWFVNLFLHFGFAVFTGLLVGFIVEVLQYFFADNRELKLHDSILDLSFWTASSFIFLLTYFVR